MSESDIIDMILLLTIKRNGKDGEGEKREYLRGIVDGASCPSCDSLLLAVHISVIIEESVPKY